MGAIMTSHAAIHANLFPPAAGIDRIPGQPAAAFDNIGEEDEAVVADRPTAEHWVRVKTRLRTELGEDVFTSWFARVDFEEADKGTVYLSVPTRFLKSWIQAHYADRLVGLWKEAQDSVARVEILGKKACNTQRIGVVSTYQPPVTG